MGLKALEIDIAYETGSEPEELLSKFYIPVLEQTKKYCRIAGFFSSSALIVASEGIEALIQNNGVMQLLISPELSEEDYRILETHGTLTPDMPLFDDLDFEEVKNDRLKLLAFLLDKGYLEIRIAIPKRGRSSLFHQKVGICLDDENESISFSGSINETAQAWVYNIEEFKVFKSWIPGQIDFLNRDLKKFNMYWNGDSDIASVYAIPEAIKKRILNIKPTDIYDLEIMKRYVGKKTPSSSNLKLFPHQEKAVEAWINNDYRLLFEMATGTGKTRTAIGCLDHLIGKEKSLFVIVSTPQNTLSRQWIGDFEELNIPVDKTVLIDGTVKQWEKKLETLLWDIYYGTYHHVVIFTTHVLASKEKFSNIIRRAKNRTKMLYVCDEVHAIGSQNNRKALLPEYEYRIGLSATPERMYDDAGTNLIRDYFGSGSFEFTIKDALNTINPLTGEPFLNSYRYNPIFVSLTDDEKKQYSKKTKQIAALMSKDEKDKEDETKLERLYEQRANIVKNASEKMHLLKALFEEMDPPTIQDTILFCSEKQIEEVFKITTQLRITRAKITESESASKIVSESGETERQEIIHNFEKGKLQVLIGIKCLDEGIDIKSAKTGILLSNSTNPREYIQRVGRVIRWKKEKPVSQIFDFIVFSDSDNGALLSKEFNRSTVIAENAINYDEVVAMFRERGVFDAN